MTDPKFTVNLLFFIESILHYIFKKSILKAKTTTEVNIQKFRLIFILLFYYLLNCKFKFKFG